MTDCNSHVFLWRADRAIPMWSGEWTPVEGSRMALAYENEMKSSWRQWWVNTHAKDEWKRLAIAINDDVKRYFGVEE